MSRWLGLVLDPASGSGGSTLETLAVEKTVVPAPAIWVPATTAQIDPGLNELNRDDEVVGRRAHSAPVSFSSSPMLTFESRAYPTIIRPLLRAALSGSVSTEGGPEPKAITSKFQSIQSGNLISYIGWLLREEQLDRITGAVVNEFDMNFPIDGEGTVTFTLPGLWHDVKNSGEEKKDPSGEPSAAFGTPSYTAVQGDTFKLRDMIVYRGAAGTTEIPNLAGLKLNFNNGLIEDPTSKFKPGHNIQKTTIEEILHKLWFPQKHKIGPQAITGTVELSGVDAAAEVRRILAHAEKMVVEVAAGPAGTTPATEDVLKIVLSRMTPSGGGGAEPLVRDGDQRASIDFGGYVDLATGTDIEVQSSGKAALT
jgi:hypothetical protein